MSEPTYRIETKHDPARSALPWSAIVYRVADDGLEADLVSAGDTEAEAITRAQKKIAKRGEREQGYTYYATEAGELCDPPAAPEPQSFRAQGGADRAMSTREQALHEGRLS